jgi:aspartate racemase
MKTIGLLGGMSWESTIPYYRIINERVAEALGGLHSARILLYSADFDEIETLQREDRWREAGELLAAAAASLQGAGAQCLVICTNTMHKVVPQIESRIDVPILHIVDATANAVRAAGMKKVGLLGTTFTMEQDFYRGRLEKEHGLDVLAPCADSRRRVHEVIYSELCRGVVSPASRARFEEVVSELEGMGAQGVILGCTEIGLLLRPEDVTLPLFDTTRLHAEAAAAFALDGQAPL